MQFDILIVGAGISGIVAAERLAKKNKKILIIEKRNHIGGNCYDCYNEKGILVHLYGPHIFHTNNKTVWEYLSCFTDWIFYRHKVLAFVEGKKIPLPFNINSLHILFPKKVAENFEEKLVSYFGNYSKIPILQLKKTNDNDLKELAEFVYNNIFLHYTLKQWNKKPEDLDPEITNRVPISISKNDEYFNDIYQGIPLLGYTEMFQKMLSNKNIHILLNTDSNDILKFSFEEKKIFLLNKEFKGNVIFTGQIEDILQEKNFLPYRSLKFVSRTEQKDYFQEAAVVNYPNEYDFTRITEFKHFTKQQNNYTTYFIEYPQEYDPTSPEKNIPYYPVPQKANKELYKKYRKKLEVFENLFLLGRLGEYEYLNMDKAVEKALILSNNLK